MSLSPDSLMLSDIHQQEGDCGGGARGWLAVVFGAK